MWIKFGLFGIIALCLLPEAVISQGYCDFCNPSCNVEVDGDDRRLEFYNGALYYFSTGNSAITWNQANSACKGLFGPSGNLASFQTKDEFVFMWNKVDSNFELHNPKRSFIGGIKVGSEWTWTDGTLMNMTLINELWYGNNPSGDGKRMEMIHTGVNDLSQSFNWNCYSYVCKIPCSSGSSDTCKCGLARRETELGGRIIGGDVTKVSEYPWQAGLTLSGGSQPFCGGSVIGDKWILTAVHCVNTYSAGQLQVLLGEHDFTNSDETSLVRKNVLQIINHPSYSDTNGLDYDYSLLELDSAIDFATNSHIRPVCLPSGSSTYAGNVAIVTGWGFTSYEGSQSSKLREVVLNVITNSACAGPETVHTTSQITSRMICAIGDRKGGCSGDSGGPLVSSGSGDGVTSGSNYELIGISSWGNGCADISDNPGVYARVTEAMDWINSNTGTLNTCPRSNSLPNQCQSGNYNTLSEASRSTTKPAALNCDGYIPGGNGVVVTSPSWAGPGWYKFVQPAGTKMATSPPTENRCGTHATGYMVDEHPTEIGETKNVKYCFNWLTNSCRWKSTGLVTKCGEEDFVYKLENVPNCTNRYCAAQ